jgi:hypothetical protein
LFVFPCSCLRSPASYFCCKSACACVRQCHQQDCAFFDSITFFSQVSGSLRSPAALFFVSVNQCLLLAVQFGSFFCQHTLAPPLDLHNLGCQLTPAPPLDLYNVAQFELSAYTSAAFGLLQFLNLSCQRTPAPPLDFYNCAQFELSAYTSAAFGLVQLGSI